MKLNLNDKKILVCGSTQGIGRATAISLANEGAKITLIARNEDKLKKVLLELPKNKNHDYIVADFSDFEALKLSVTKYLENNSGFHVLINNTGGPKSGLILKI